MRAWRTADRLSVECHTCSKRRTLRDLGFTRESDCAWYVLMFQPDLFVAQSRIEPVATLPRVKLDLPAILAHLTTVCKRPRYCFMVLNLIAKISTRNGEAGPFVDVGETRVPIRDWLSDALAPVAQRDPRRLSIARRVRAELVASNALPRDAEEAAAMVDGFVRQRILLSGRTNVSRAVSELVRAGFVRRYYQGYRIDHQNRGAQRHAVYSVHADVRCALRPD